ncbi:IS3 family transposase, partial [Saccharopolyspora sp. HNM0986]|uniref:IS3 family transposase n=1 Tax=Saccharopolyspora galaxeae TaxID=2781241 RepID=UPI00190B674F
TQQQRRDGTLTEKIRSIMQHHRHRLGTRRVRDQLARLGEQVSHKRVYRLMQAAGLRCRHPRRRRASAPQDGEQSALVDLVGRDFTAEAPDEKWVGDITYLATDEGWAYLATVLDCYSRKIVGWRLDTHLRTELATESLSDAIARRNPDGTIFNSDRGCQYTSRSFRDFCRSNGIRPSVGATGSCFDNSVAESFFATLKKELIHGHHWASVSDLRVAVFQFIEGYYNRRRPHSTNNYRTPEEQEDEFAKLTLTAA